MSDDPQHDHDHEHDHPHNAPPNPYLAPRRTADETSALKQRVQAIETLLIDKGLVSSSISMSTISGP